MKWGLLAVAILGASTYAVIFFTQYQHDRSEQLASDATPIDVPAEMESVATPFEETGATNQAVEVSNPADDVEVRTFDGEAWTTGVQAYEQGDFELAVDALRVAVEEKEESAYRHFLLGLAHRRLGDPESAVTELERSVELQPRAVRSLLSLSRAYLELEETESARIAVDAALEQNLEFADAWQVLGRIELSEGNLEAAESAFRRATDHDQGHAWAQNNLGYALILQERFAEALRPLQSAVATGTEEAVFFNNLGVALERSGHLRLAATSFGLATQIGHGPAEAAYDRVAQVLDARVEAYPNFDELALLDGAQMAQRVDDALVAAELVASVEMGAEEVVLDHRSTEFEIDQPPR